MYVIWKCPALHITKPHLFVSIGSSNGLAPSYNKPFHEPMFTQRFYLCLKVYFKPVDNLISKFVATLNACLSPNAYANWYTYMHKGCTLPWQVVVELNVSLEHPYSYHNGDSIHIMFSKNTWFTVRIPIYISCIFHPIYRSSDMYVADVTFIFQRGSHSRKMCVSGVTNTAHMSLWWVFPFGHKGKYTCIRLGSQSTHSVPWLMFSQINWYVYIYIYMKPWKYF